MFMNDKITHDEAVHAEKMNYPPNDGKFRAFNTPFSARLHQLPRCIRVLIQRQRKRSLVHEYVYRPGEEQGAGGGATHYINRDCEKHQPPGLGRT